MNKPSNTEIYIHQLGQVKHTLDSIYDAYPHLLLKRLKDTLSRDEYMIYDLCDILIHLNAIVSDVTSNDKIYPDYVLEKLYRIRDYTNATIAYFEHKEVKND